MKLKRIAIGDLGKVVTGKTPPTKERQFYDGEYPFITPTDLSYDSYRVWDTATTLSSDARAKYSNQFLPKNSITFTCIASVGKIGIATTESLTNQQINSVVVNSEHDWRFVYYLLRHETRRIQGMCSGVATPIINKRDFERVEVDVPENLAIEHGIADILSTYDDLIENNRRRIRLLEEAARLLYREWFVHLRFPGHEHVAVVDGVPERWEKATMGDIGDIVTGKTPSKKRESFYGDDVPFIKTPDMHNNTVVISTDESLSEEGANSQANKTLPPRSILVSCIGTVGVVAFNATAAQTNQQINAIIPRSKTLRYWAFFAAETLKPLLEGMSGGATMANVNKSKFASLAVVIPSKLMLKQFALKIEPIVDQIEKLSRANSHLAHARDLLLPRLMNGEISV